MKADINNRTFLTTTEVAKILNCHPMTIRRMVKSGSLPCLKVGKHIRIAKDIVQNLLEGSLNVKNSSK